VRMRHNYCGPDTAVHGMTTSRGSDPALQSGALERRDPSVSYPSAHCATEKCCHSVTTSIRLIW
jgi:hypothetical protein